ncbi:hypothetical protein ACNHOZ_28500 [Priestia sp. D51]
MSKVEQLRDNYIYDSARQVSREQIYKQTELSLTTKWGDRGNILNLGKTMNEMTYHKGKRIMSARHQIQLLYGWFLQCEDRRTRVIGKAWFEEKEGFFDSIKDHVMFSCMFTDEERSKLLDTDFEYRQKFFKYKEALRVMKKITEDRVSQFILTNPVFAKPYEIVNNYGRRTTDRLTEYHVLYSELDHYNPQKALPKYTKLTAEEVYKLIVKKLDAHGFPRPTEVTFSRGPQLWWKIGPIPSFMLEEWEMMMAYINELLQEFGADAHALDGVRILRAVGSINEKTKKKITGRTYSDDRLDFMNLFQQFCWDRWLKYLEEKERKRQERMNLVETRYNEKRKWLLENGIIDDKGEFTEKYNPNKRKRRINKQARQHHWNMRHQNIINGIFHLCHLRKGDMEGFREFSCFLVYTMALRIHGGVELLAQKEVYELYESFDVKKYEWHDLLNRISSAEADYKRWERGDYQNVYKYSTEKLIKKLKITPEEMKKMRYIVDVDRVAELKRDYDRRYQKERYLKKLQEQGKMTKKEEKAFRMKWIQEYLESNPEAADNQIAKELGVSRSTVNRLINEYELK